MRFLAPLLILAVALPAPAQPPSPFAHFHEACTEARRGSRLARVSFYGASHTAPDVLPDRLRAHLQRRCGDGGPGWVVPAQPFAFYDHRRASYGGRGWRGLVARGRRPAMDHYGLAGIALDGAAGARASLRLEEPAALSVHLLRAPGGGAVRLRGTGLDREVSTAGETGVLIADAGRRSRLRLEVMEGAARVFGVVAERQSGAVVDNFGVPGARARDQLRWREESLEPSVRARSPDLWILAYGTNESIDGRVPIDRYRRRLREVITRWKRRAPHASCLLVGPGDWPRERRDGTLRERPRIEQVSEAQRAEAAAAGCAFFHTLGWMGGPLSMERWMAEGLALGDRVHFTDAGYHRLGDALAATILTGAPRTR